ncbi:MAG: penicillin-binding protein 1C, partial [Pseudomonadota bacterium]
RRTVHFEPALEPGRPEWFIDGTEADTVTVLADARQVPRIVYPGSGSIIAIDPDIPREVERVYFQAQAGQGLQWQLDGEVLGSASASLPWRPAPGKHVLALVDGQQQSVAQSHFVVRGSDRAD